MPKAMGKLVRSGSYAKVESHGPHTCGPVGPMRKGATSRVGNSTKPPNKSGSSTVKGGKPPKTTMHPSGGKRAPGARTPRSSSSGY